MFFFKKRRPRPSRPRQEIWIDIEQEGERKRVSTSELEKLTGAAYIPELDLEKASIILDIRKRTQKHRKRGELTRRQLWNGSYYKKELEGKKLPPIFLRYIDSEMGWGVFAAKAIGAREWIGEYTGVLRKRRRSDRKNAYCFEYTTAHGEKTPYTIDAQDQGGLTRYINHSDTPNLSSELATIDDFSHVIFVTNRVIAPGEQLFYDYGPGYWADIGIVKQ